MENPHPPCHSFYATWERQALADWGRYGRTQNGSWQRRVREPSSYSAIGHIVRVLDPIAVRFSWGMLATMLRDVPEAVLHTIDAVDEDIWATNSQVCEVVRRFFEQYDEACLHAWCDARRTDQ